MGCDDGLWCSLNYTQRLFGKASDLSPWDDVQPFLNLLIHSLCIYLQAATFSAYPQAIVLVQTHSLSSGLCCFKCFYAEKHESTLIHQYLQPMIPNALTQQNSTFQYQFLIRMTCANSEQCPGAAKCYLTWVKSCQKNSKDLTIESAIT